MVVTIVLWAADGATTETEFSVKDTPHSISPTPISLLHSLVESKYHVNVNQGQNTILFPPSLSISFVAVICAYLTLAKLPFRETSKLS